MSSSCELVHVTPLASLTALTQLGLQENQIKGVTPLASLTALTLLDLRGNKIEDVTPLTSLTSYCFFFNFLYKTMWGVWGEGSRQIKVDWEMREGY